MKGIFKHWNILGLYYAITLALTMVLIISGAHILQIDDITWALISGVVCTEIDAGQASQLAYHRIIATLMGVSLALAILLIAGASYTVTIIGITAIALLAYQFLQQSWKLATATSILVFTAGLQQHSLDSAELYAIERALEVIGGSVIAFVVSYIMMKLYKKLHLL